MGERRYNVGIPVRDGARLRADIYFPAGEAPHPTVVGRTPYGKNNPGYARLVDAWNSRGYVLVLQDVRGRGDSDGEFTPYRNEGRDGYDTIEWVATQAWSNGDVVTHGGSYGARTAWLTAHEHPPHLKAMIVMVSPSDPFVESPTSGESPMSICWHRIVDGRMVQNVEALDWMSIYEHLPLITMDERAGFSSPHWREALSHTVRDDYWEPLRYQHRFGELDLPVLHVSGWYDDEQVGTPLNFAGMATGAKSDRARRSQGLLMGPWGHAPNAGRKLGEVDFGPTAVIEFERYLADWLDGVLGRTPPQPAASVRIFVMGVNEWRDEGEWPLARTRYTDYHLHGGGNANSRFGDGTLSREPPTDEVPDRFTYDPARPVPFITDALSNQIGGPDDYSAIEQRGDVLCYTTDVLTEELEVTGPVKLVLHASSSAVDTDFTAKLVDVHPSGFCQRLCDGVVRARYRDGVDHAVLMEPGTVYEMVVDMWNTCQVFKAGHRVRLEVSSSAFPKYDRNLNTGDDIGLGTRMNVAENRVWHDAAHPSRLVLPVIPPAGG